jgi:hypothetical protein
VHVELHERRVPAVLEAVDLTRGSAPPHSAQCDTVSYHGRQIRCGARTSRCDVPYSFTATDVGDAFFNGTAGTLLHQVR